MKTDDLVSLLAAHAAPVPAHAVARRFALGLGLGLPLAALLLAATLGVRADLAHVLVEHTFWLKLVFAATLALGAFVVTERLARPGMRLGHAGLALAAPLLLLWLLSSAELLAAAPAQRSGLVLGETWKTCAFNIAMISLPLFAAMLWVMKGLAPTRLALAGAASGLLAGALGTLVYAFHCPESSAAFVGIWYVLGIAIPTLAGAMLGPRVLRW